jgi:hypothetical protein
MVLPSLSLENRLKDVKSKNTRVGSEHKIFRDQGLSISWLHNHFSV